MPGVPETPGVADASVMTLPLTLPLRLIEPMNVSSRSLLSCR